MSRIRVPVSPKIADQKTDRALRDQARTIGDIAKLPASSMRIVPDVSLDEGMETPVLHGLGRPAMFVKTSDPRGAIAIGRVDEVRESQTHSRDKYVVLRATGWGGTITVDIMVS